jgi:hypothetical protein
MRLPYSFVLLLLAVAPVPSSAAPSHAVKRLHNFALKHSSGFARNIRVAFNPILVSQPLNGTTSQNKLYCVSRKPKSQIAGAENNGHPYGNSTTSVGSSARPTSTSGGSTSTTGGSNPTQTPSSNFKLVQSYVRLPSLIPCHIC